MLKSIVQTIIVLSLSLVSAQSNDMAMADSLYQTGNFSKAIELYKTHAQSSGVAEKIAKSYYALGNYGAALKYYESALQRFPDDALIRYDYAKLLSRTKKYDLASKEFNTLIVLDQDNPNFHYELGLIKEKQNDTLALAEFQKTFDLDQTHQKAIFKIAKHLIKKRQHLEAFRLIETGLSSYAENIELLSLKAQNYYYSNQFDDAILAFEKLIEMGEGSEFIHEKLSLSYAENSDYEKAIEQRKLAVDYNPMDANALFVIGTYYAKLQDFENAESYITQALKIKDVPLDYEYQFLGTLFNRQKKYPQAIAMFEKSLKEDPDNMSSAFFLVTTKDVYFKDRELVLKFYQDIKAKYPDSFVEKLAARRIQELKEEKFLKAED